MKLTIEIDIPDGLVKDVAKTVVSWKLYERCPNRQIAFGLSKPEERGKKNERV